MKSKIEMPGYKEAETELPEFVKTEGFEKAIVFMMVHAESLWKAMKEYKSFRMVMEYDAEALNVYFRYFTPDGSECSSPGSEEV